MSDSNDGEQPARRREERRRRRIEAVERWVEYTEEQPPEVWGEQQNRLVNSQLESARKSRLDAEHYRRVRRAGRDE